jgi:hypothetical protein
MTELSEFSELCFAVKKHCLNSLEILKMMVKHFGGTISETEWTGDSTFNVTINTTMSISDARDKKKMLWSTLYDTKEKLFSASNERLICKLYDILAILSPKHKMLSRTKCISPGTFLHLVSELEKVHGGKDGSVFDGHKFTNHLHDDVDLGEHVDQLKKMLTCEISVLFDMLAHAMICVYNTLVLPCSKTPSSEAHTIEDLREYMANKDCPIMGDISHIQNIFDTSLVEWNAQQKQSKKWWL